MKTIFLLLFAFFTTLFSNNVIAADNSVYLYNYTVNSYHPGDRDPNTNQFITVPLPNTPGGTVVAIHLTLRRYAPVFNAGGQRDNAYVAFYIGSIGSQPRVGSTPGATTANGSPFSFNTARFTSDLNVGGNSLVGFWRPVDGNDGLEEYETTIPLTLPGSPNGTNTGSTAPYLFAVAIEYPANGGKVLSSTTGMPLVYPPVGDPVITSITPDNPSLFSTMTIRGTSLTNSTEVLFYDAVTPGPPVATASRVIRISDTEVNITVPNGAIPAGAASAMRRVVVLTVYAGYGRVSNLYNLNVIAAISPTAPPSINGVRHVPTDNNPRRAELLAGYDTRFELYRSLTVTINGILATNLTLDFTTNAERARLYVDVPAGAALPYGPVTGPFVLHTSVGDSNPVFFTQNSFPCNYDRGRAICDDQAVPYGSLPALIQGRALADWGLPVGDSWASVDEHEWVQWQYSYTNNWNDWHDIDGNATSRNFQPWPCYGTAYYRRKSTHIEYNGINTRREWYISNVVTIIPYVTITPGLYQIRNRHTGQVLEIGGGGGVTNTNGAYANQWPYVGTANQEWVITSTSDGMYKITNRNSGQALEIGGSNTPQPPGAVANQWPYWGGLNQQWLFQPIYNSQGFFTIASANSGHVLEIPYGSSQQGARAGQWNANAGTVWSQWELVPVNVPTSTRFPGVYTIKNINSNQVLEMGAAATNDGAKANQLLQTGTANQQWTLTDAGGGFLKINNRNSGLTLEIGGGASAGGELVQQWSYWGGLYQQWSIEEVAPSVYKIINRNSNQALEIGGGSTQSGAYANQWPYWGGTNQQWALTLVSQNKVARNLENETVQQSRAYSESTLSSKRQEAVSSELSLYPNPASTILNISLSNNLTPKFVRITDLTGAVVTMASYQGRGQVDISILAAGAYIITVGDGKREYHKRFVKQ